MAGPLRARCAEGCPCPHHRSGSVRSSRRTDEAIEADLGDLFAGVPAFDFRLVEVRRWPLVVYLAPEPRSPFRSLTETVVARFPAYPPYEGRFDEVIPHLTVAECETGGCEDPEAILGEVERAIVSGVPIQARAREVWLMTGNERWSLRRRFLLEP